jgi:hypothetical protein
MRSVGRDLCDNVRARKNRQAVFGASKTMKKRPLQQGRGLQRSSLFRTQITHRFIHRQYVAFIPQNALSCSPLQKKPYM